VALVGLWVVVIAVQALRLVRSYGRLRDVIHRSVPVSDEDAAVVPQLASAVGLPRVPRIRESAEIDAPQVVGLRRPIVLVPSRSRTVLSADDRMMALCHELMHIRRRDLALGWVPALAERRRGSLARADGRPDKGRRGNGQRAPRLRRERHPSRAATAN